MSSTSIPTPNPTSPAWNKYLENQSFNVTGLDGSPVTLTFAEVNQLIYDNTSDGIVSGFTIGFCSMLFIVLFLITVPKRRRQPILLLNIFSMFLLVFKAICESVIDCASFSGVGLQLLVTYYAYGKSTWVPIVIQGIINPFLYASIMASLLLQVRVIFAAEPLSQKIVTGIGIVAILVEEGICITNTVYAIMLQYDYPNLTSVPDWLYRTMRLYFLIYISIGCAVFLYKLALTIYRRKKMGINVKQLGPMQIIFIAFTQCLIVPLVIYIIDYTQNSTTIYIDIAQSFLVCSLPLSSLWASTEVNAHGQVTSSNATKDSSSSSGSHPQGKFSFFSRSKKMEDSRSDLEKAPGYTTEGIQLHPPTLGSNDTTLGSSDHH